jgi:ribosomal protein S1
MFQNDEIVVGKIYQVEEYGVYLSCGEENFLVLIVDVSRERVRDLHALFSVGDTVKVRVLENIPAKRIYKASMILNH